MLEEDHYMNLDSSKDTGLIDKYGNLTNTFRSEIREVRIKYISCY